MKPNTPYHNLVPTSRTLGFRKLQQRLPIFVQCPVKANPYPITLLGVNKLFSTNNSIAQKIIWFFVLAVSIGLCTWQVSICFDKFLARPIGTEVKIQVFYDTVFPAITVCPHTSKIGCEFHLTFDQFCSKIDACNRLPENEKHKLQFEQLNTSLQEMWAAKQIHLVGINVNCDYAVDSVECSRLKNKTVQVNVVDTLVGRCLTFRNDMKWHFAGKSAWSWWVDVTWPPNHLSGLDVAIHQSPTVDKLAIPTNHLKSYNRNHLGIVMIQFVYLNASRRPCITENERIRCVNDCANEKFAHINASCKWPFLKTKLPVAYCKSQQENEDLREKLIQLKFMLSECKCKRACETYTYVATTTFYENKENVEKNVTTVGMVLAGNTKQVVTEFYLYPGTSLVADLGGSIGLFLGSSLLSVFELMHAASLKMFKLKK